MISIGLNVILGVMLFCALVLGLRLERRLRALRESHVDFAKAVSELDQAALRTEGSLAKLRAGTDEARTEIASRIDQARLLAQRLERLVAEGDRVLNQPLPLTPAMRSAPPPAAPQAETRSVEPRAPQARAQEVRAPEIRPFVRPEPVAASRSRALVDDDLFEIVPERRPALASVMGGRR